jgi:hypothetical protein
MYVYDFDSEILILKKCLKHKSKLSNCFWMITILFIL